jgi:hypothetical protein
VTARFRGNFKTDIIRKLTRISTGHEYWSGTLGLSEFQLKFGNKPLNYRQHGLVSLTRKNACDVLQEFTCIVVCWHN